MADTVAVNLNKGWVSPGGTLYEVEGNPHEFPAAFAEKPKKADGESDGAFAERSKRQPYAVLPSSAEVIPEVEVEVEVAADKKK